MKCQNCEKREAVVDYTQIIDGNKLHLHLCDKCANEMKIGMDFMFDMDDVFSTFFNGMPALEKAEILKCKTCGSTYEDFKNTGKLGCANCYITFKNELDNVLKRLHGSNRNVKSNRNLGETKVVETTKNRIDDLKDQLKECIKNEEYEKAAKLRDEIKSLENKRGED